MSDVLILAAALAPGFLVLAAFLASGRFRQPRASVWQTFLLGFAVVLPVALLEAVIAQILPLPLYDRIRMALFQAFVIWAIPEETAKLLALFHYCMRIRRFEDPGDGVIYGMALALGFAAFENVFYLARENVTWTIVTAVRVLTAMPLHLVAGACMGLFGVFARTRPRRRGAFFVLALLVPVGLHGFYNFFMLARLPYYLPDLAAMLTLMAPSAGVVLVGLILAWALFRRLSAVPAAAEST